MTLTKDDIRDIQKIREKYMFVVWEDEKIDSETYKEICARVNTILYARVSSDGQEDNTSLFSQVELSYGKAREKWNVNKDQCIVIMESKSTDYLLKREGMALVRKLIKDRIGIRRYVARHPDRTSRIATHQSLLHEEFGKSGIEIQYAKFNFEDTNEGKLNQAILANIAEYYKNNLKSLTSQGRIDKIRLREEHIPVNLIFGYKYDKKIDRYVIDETEADVVNYIVKLFMETDMSRNQIAVHLAEKKYKTASGSLNWTTTTITRILTNETFFTGVNWYQKTKVVMDENENKKQVPKHKDDWHELEFPVIVTDYNFEAVQKRLEPKIRKSNGRPTNNRLLSRIVFCGRCGRKASRPVVSTTKKHKLYYYSCCGKDTRKFDQETGEKLKIQCEGKNWRVDHVDEIVWNNLKKHLKNADFILEQLLSEKKDSNNSSNLKKEKSKLEKQVEKMQNANKEMINDYYSGDSPFTSKEEMLNFKKSNDQKIIEINLKIEEIDNELKLVEGEFNDKELLEEYLKKWTGIFQSENIDVQSKKMILNGFVESVTLDDDMTCKIKYKWNVNDELYLNIQERTTVSTKNGGEINFESEHSNGNFSESHSNVFYADVIERFDEAYNTDMKEKYKWAEYLDKQDEIVNMYQKDLMTLKEIGETLNIDYWNIEEILNYLEIPKLSIKERAKLKREKDFDKIYDLHYNKKFSLNEIYREYGFSPIYCKAVLSDKGLSHQGFKNQLDLAKEKKNLSPITEKVQEKIAKDYIKSGDRQAVAKKYNIALDTVTSYAKKYGYFELKAEKRSKLEQSIINDYLNGGIGISALAKKYGYKSNTAIQRILKKHNIETRPSPQQYIQMLRNGEANAPVYNKYHKMKKANMKLNIDKISDDDLFELVIVEKVSSSEIGWLFSCGRTKVYNRRERCNLIHNQTKEKLNNLKKSKSE